MKSWRRGNRWCGMNSRKLNTCVYLSDSTDPVWNLAVEEYLTLHTEPDEVILYLWQNDDTIVDRKSVV